MCYSEAAAHAVATLAEATLQGGGQIVLAETAAAVGALAGVQDATGTYSSMTVLSPAGKTHFKRHSIVSGHFCSLCLQLVVFLLMNNRNTSLQNSIQLQQLNTAAGLLYCICV